MKYFIQSFAVLFALALFTPIQSNAQTQPDDPTTRKKKKEKPPRYELVYDLLWLIDKNTFPATSLMGRYHFKQTETKGMALRVRLGGTYDHYKFHDRERPDSIYDINNSILIQTRLGLEWQKKWSRIQINYGIDGLYSYSGEISHKAVAVFNGATDERFLILNDTNATTQIGIAALIGFKISLYRRISIYGESNLSGIISTYHSDGVYYTILNDKTIRDNGYSYSNQNFFSLKTTLLSTIGISFTF